MLCAVMLLDGTAVWLLAATYMLSYECNEIDLYILDKSMFMDDNLFV
jgi:predicted nucleotidyltransferase